ncbi:MAG: glycosyltransferase family 2 protein [Elusimicrobiota bacterium]
MQKSAAENTQMCLLLPAYNEEISLKKLVPRIDEILRTGYSILVVNDGSSDGTADLCRSYSLRYPLKCISLKKNSGPGAAISAGLEYILEKMPDIKLLVIMDADNTHEPEYIDIMVTKIRDNDIVIASRYADKGRQIGVNLLRRFLSYTACVLCSVMFPAEAVRDYTCGFRMYRLDFIKKYFKAKSMLPVVRRGFAANTEILLELLRYGARCTEIPFTLRYDLKETGSKMKIFSTVFEYFSLFIEKRFGLRKTA